jgi:nucleoside-diphosphate-sugar epimerase
MRVFVAGATGVIGRALVPALLRDGHEVTGMTRSTARAAALERAGAAAAVCDAFDAGGLTAAVRDARPEVVVHVLTDLPRGVRGLARGARANHRLRREGTRNLVAAAARAGARRVVAESIAFLYAPEGEMVKTEDGRPWTDAPRSYAATIGALLELERAVTEYPGIEGVVLRYGWLYGPGTWFARDGLAARLVRRRLFPRVDGGLVSWLHVEDAAGATVRALAGGRPGIYNVVDDTPVPWADWLVEYARLLGAPRPLRLPARVADRLGGFTLTRQRGATNARARRELGWRPLHPDWREGFTTL